MSGLTVMASGKGGVGKTFLSVSLGHALARRGRRVLLVDADLGLANIDVQLGLEPAMPLARAIRADLDPARLIRRHAACGFDVLGGGGAGEDLAGLGDGRLARMVDKLADLARTYDHVLVDLASGLERLAPIMLERAATLVVVGNNEPTALTDNYAFIKFTRGAAPVPWFLANDVSDAAEGRLAHATLQRALRRFLDLDCRHLGSIRHDRRVAEAIRRQMPYLDRSPQAEAAAEIVAVAKQLAAAPGAD